MGLLPRALPWLCRPDYVRDGARAWAGAWASACIVWLLTAAGCGVQPRFVACGDVLCPMDAVCMPSGTCANAALVASCEGRAEGAACEASGLNGTCREGVCVAAVCGDFVVDRELGEVCDDGNQIGGDGCSATCRSDESCGNGIVELGEACDCGDADATTSPIYCAGTVNGGDICRVDCKLPRCGNHELDPGEICDDGNLVSGDGCAGNCTSDETCGNAIVDMGEQCDDGNLLSHDGCTARCLGEQWIWSAIATATPPARRGAAMAFLPARGALVMFGGLGAQGLLDDTWLYQGGSWTKLELPLAPSGRYGHAMAYHPIRDTLILFGGLGEQGYQADTWEFDGTAWHEIAGNGPSPRAFSAMAPLPSEGDGAVVMMGGMRGVSLVLGDSWRLDANGEWGVIANNAPPPRYGHAMAYEPHTGTIVLVGGTAGVSDTPANPMIAPDSMPELGPNVLSDTWQFDGAAWQPVASTPVKRAFATLTYEPSTQSLFLIGGRGDDASFSLADSSVDFRFTTAVGWSLSEPISAPVARASHTAALNAITGEITVFGGTTAGNALSDTTLASGREVELSLPRGAMGNQVVYLPLAGRIVWPTLLQQEQTSEIINPTTEPQSYGWVNEVGWWRKFTLEWPDEQRGLEGYAAVAYVGASQDFTLLFGGTRVGETTAALWRLQTDRWERVTAGAEPWPSPRAYTALAFDAATQRMWMFGGASASDAEGVDGALNDVWTYQEGSGWQQGPLSTPCEARWDHAMAVASRHGKLVVFGGRTESTVLAQTCVATGDGAWHVAASTPGPSPRYGHAMTYDPQLDLVIVHGGLSPSGVALSDAWGFDPATETWTKLAPLGTPSAAFRHGMAYDTRRQRLVIAGGFDINLQPNRQVFELQMRELAAHTDEQCDDTTDNDDDGAIRCDDPDCWGTCAPICPPFSTCDALAPRCGDGLCIGGVETTTTCPQDCMDNAAQAACGDLVCAPSEALAASCPGDCL